MLINLKDIFENDFEKIENEIKNSYLSSDLMIGFSSLLGNIESFVDLLVHFRTLGVHFCDDIIPLFNLSPNNLKIKFTVPCESELFYATDDGEIHYLCGQELSRIVKQIIISVIENFCIRSEICSLDTNKIKFMCKEVDMKYTDAIYNDALDTMHHCKSKSGNDAQNNLSPSSSKMMDKFLSRPHEEKELILKSYTDQIQHLAWYGITVTNESMKSILRASDNPLEANNVHICFSVPSSSCFLHDGKEIAGENAFKYAIDAYNNVSYTIPLSNASYQIRDEHWTKEKFDDMYSVSNQFADAIGKMI